MARLPISSSLVVFAPIVFAMLTGRLLSPLTSSWISTFPAYRFLLYAIWNGIVLGLLFLSLRRHHITWRDLGLSRFRWTDQVIAIGAMLVGTFVLFPLGKALAGLLGLPVSASGAIPLVDPVAAVSAIVLPCAIIPIAEELLFRGFLLSLLAAKLEDLMMVGLLGIAMFGLMHIGFYGVSDMFLAVLLWTPLPVGLYLWRRSVWAAGTLHILNNLFGLVIAPLLAQ